MRQGEVGGIIRELKRKDEIYKFKYNPIYYSPEHWWKSGWGFVFVTFIQSYILRWKITISLALLWKRDLKAFKWNWIEAHNAEERVGQGNHMDIYIKDDTHFHFLKREIFNSHKIEWQRYWVIGLNSQMHCACENSIAFLAYNHLVNGCQGLG